VKVFACERRKRVAEWVSEQEEEPAVLEKRGGGRHKNEKP